MAPYDRFTKELEGERLLRGVRVTSKNELYPLWRTVDIILKVLSFWRIDGFLTKYTTTLGKTIYFPTGWKIEDANMADYITLKHELVHVGQFNENGNGIGWLGVILFALFYLFLPVPIVFAWFRYTSEREAYLESIRTIKSLGREPDVEWYVAQLSGPAYLWAWPFKKSIRNWFRKKLEKKKP